MIFCNSNIEIEQRLEYKKRFSVVLSSQQKIPKQGIALLSFDEIGINCIMTYKKSGRVATQIDRITFRNPIFLEESIILNDIIDYLLGNVKTHFKRQTGKHISVFSKKVEIGLLNFIQEKKPKIFNSINDLALRLSNAKPRYNPKVEVIIAQEKDAVNLVFKMFNFEESDVPAWSSDDSSAPFLKGYKHLTIREDPMVNHDSQVFGDWSKVSQYTQGAVAFEKDNQKITIMNVNRQPLEKTLGVDLLIYHHTYESYILIQYKRMIKEKELYVYRPSDSSYKSEIDRMRSFMKTLNTKKESTVKNYRLNNDFFYFKLCPAKIENLNSNRMVSGMYIPLKLWDLLLEDKSTSGPKGGKQLSYQNTNRYINNTQFINLAQNGWIGSRIEDSSKLTNIIMSSINSDNSLFVAKLELYDKTEK